MPEVGEEESLIPNQIRDHMSKNIIKHLILPSPAPEEENKVNPPENHQPFSPSPQRPIVRVLAITEHVRELIGLISGIKFSLQNFRFPWEISSLPEKQIKRELEKVETISELINYHQKLLTRVFPSATRIQLENMEPAHLWSTGIQIISMNYYNKDDGFLINHALFSQNGGTYSGYVLKPLSLIQPIKIPRKSFVLSHEEESKIQHVDVGVNRTCKLNVRLLSLNSMPLTLLEVDDVVDIFVQFEIKGRNCDQMNISNLGKRSSVVESKGFRTVWKDEEFEFRVEYPEFAFLLVKVMGIGDTDEETGEPEERLLCWNAMSLAQIRQGYRIVPLLDTKLKQLAFSNIFAKFKLY